MRVEVDLAAAPPRAVLHEPGEMRSFDVVITGAGAGDLVGGMAAAGIPRFEQHAWVPVALLRELAGDAADAEWEASFAKLLEFARGKGWYDEELDAVRGHVA